MSEFIQLLTPYFDDLLKTDHFLDVAEHCGCHLLRSNITKLAMTLHEVILIMEHAVYPHLETHIETASFVAADHEFDHIEDQIHAIVDLMGDTEEKMNAHFKEIQALLDATLPKIEAHINSMAKVQLPALDAAIKPEEAAKLAAEIKAVQRSFIEEEEARKAAAAAAFLKTRAGRKAKLIEEEMKREEEARKHPQKEGEEGGKKKKGADKEDDGPHKPSVRERRLARDAWHAEHVLHQAPCESCGKPKAPGHTHPAAKAAKPAAH